MATDYHNARCAAIMRNGRRCSGGWASARAVTFVWDPVKGEGLDGPWVVLCRRHNDVSERIKRGERIRIWRGWLGGANQYHYSTGVWARRTGWTRAAWWWARRRPRVAGGPERLDAA
jgi:hypothetical protein